MSPWRQSGGWMGSMVAGAQQRLKSWGGPMFGSQTLRMSAGGGRPSRCGGLGVSPRKIFETQMLNPAFLWLLRSLVGSRGRVHPSKKNYGQKVGEPIHCWFPKPKRWGPVSPGPHSCCAWPLPKLGHGCDIISWPREWVVIALYNLGSIGWWTWVSGQWWAQKTAQLRRF